MRIGISARGLSVPIGGARRILDEALRQLPRLGADHEVVAYQPSGMPVAPGVTPVWVDAPLPVWWEWVSLPRAIRSEPPDVLFAPKTLLPPGLPARTRTLSLVLDLLYFPIQGKYLHEYQWRDIVYNRLFFRDSCRRATALACISEHTRNDLLAVCPDLPPEKVHVVPLGVTSPAPETLSPERVAAVRTRHGLSRPYVFYAGSLSPRKNMVRGIRAWARLANRLPHDLVVTAGKSWRDREVEAEVDHCGLRSRFRRLGAVPESDMPALYAGADVFFFPSLYEGFGLPVLEAMACGCPVVASNASSIPEAAGGAACLVDPLDEPAMAEALFRVLTERAMADELREAGRKRATLCSWDRTVRNWLDLMERMCHP
jgi:glycosyltransferase involved in cell wall biosynthesis